MYKVMPGVGEVQNKVHVSSSTGVGEIHFHSVLFLQGDQIDSHGFNSPWAKPIHPVSLT